MALDFLKLADDKLAKEFNKKPEKDVMPARRAKVLESIDKALAAIKAGEDNPKRGAYSTKDKVSKATLRLGARKLSIKGEEEFFVPRERLADFYTQARASVAAGELDAAITASLGQVEAFTAKRAPSETAREIEPWKVYRRNLSRYGQERADELLDKKFGKDAGEVRKAYEANKDS
jgi:predicted transcriptional regulator